VSVFLCVFYVLCFYVSFFLTIWSSYLNYFTPVKHFLTLLCEKCNINQLYLLTPRLSSTNQSEAGPSEGVPASTCQRTPIYKPFTQCRPPMECPPHPAPHDVSEEELHHVRACLQRWRSEVESSITGRTPTHPPLPSPYSPNPHPPPLSPYSPNPTHSPTHYPHPIALTPWATVGGSSSGGKSGCLATGRLLVQSPGSA